MKYSDKEAYWGRRRAVETFFHRLADSMPGVNEKKQKINEIWELINNRNETYRYRCVYAFREGQKLAPDDGYRGGYKDSWWRSNHFNMERVDDEDDVPPIPNKPITVYLKPRDTVPTYCTEFVECWHPMCQAENENKYPGGHPPHVIYLLCSGHATNSVLLESLQDFCMKGTEPTDPAATAMIADITEKLRAKINSTLDYSLKRAEETLAEVPMPCETLEVVCYDRDQEEEFTFYIDRKMCERKILTSDDDDDEYEGYKPLDQTIDDSYWVHIQNLWPVTWDDGRGGAEISAYDALLREVRDDLAVGTIKLGGRECKEGRMTTLYSMIEGADMKYSGRTLQPKRPKRGGYVHTIFTLFQDPDFIALLAEQHPGLERVLPIPNAAFINWYRPPSELGAKCKMDGLGPHSDDTSGMQSDVIVSITLCEPGGERLFSMHDKASGNVAWQAELADGDIIIMLPGCQKHYKHSVSDRVTHLDRSRITGGRLNITLRQLKLQ